ncbi:DUF3788 domain-containing protein [uncultured Robinsoniella sp.]|uniref:DUF3788 domain-containing protein n=1 Tax=uncultured Robinsoniella sp. TaxID=904190 RepID=UPI00374EC7B6
MYERLLNKQEMPTITEMTAYCGKNAALFRNLNEWLSDTYDTKQKITFPYGKHYGWGISHRKKEKLICNIFAECEAFTVMIRLSDKQFGTIYDNLQKFTQEYIDDKYPCGDGGWIQYRVTSQEHFHDIQTILSVKCS